MSLDLIERDGFKRLADVAMEASSADHTFVSLSDTAGGTTRFANNQIVQNVHVRRQSLSVTVAFGKQRGSASTTDISDEAVRAAARRAEEIAKVSPEDPEYLPPLGARDYPVYPTLRQETADAGPARRIADARTAIELCKSADLQGAGIVSAYVSATGLAADTGLFAYEPRSRAQFSLTATGENSTGWVNNANRSIDDLGVAERTRIAIEKAQRSAKPTELPAGRYTVILEPAAVAGLVGPMSWVWDAKAYYKGTSPFSGKLGVSIVDQRLTLQNRPDHPSLMGASFNGYGLASNSRTWIERGVLKELDYDRFSAKEHDVEPSFGLDAPHLSGENPVGESVADLIETTERGVLVTNFWYIRFVNPKDLTLTGMTRDGTFLIEDGKLGGGLINFRFHESPLRAFNQIEAFTTPLDAITMERGKMLLPAMKIRDFNFSSVTRF